MSTTPSPPDADTPTYASCQDLSKVFYPGEENQLSYLPEERWLLVSPNGITYKIDLVNDTDCIAANPALASFMSQFRTSLESDQRAECHASLEQLAAGTMTVGDKSTNPEALRNYAASVCEPLGIPVPR